MEPKDNWIEDFNDVEKDIYKIYKFYRMSEQFQKLDILSTNIAVAKFGGPIAIARKSRDQIILLDSGYKDNILFFTNEGSLLSQVTFIDEYKTSDIVGFDFTASEFLIAVFQKGDYYIIDQFRKEKRQKNLGQQFQVDQIKQVKVFDNGFAFITNSNTMYFIQDVDEPVIKQFSNSDTNKESPKSWHPIPSKYSLSNKVEIHYTLGSGIGVLIEDEKKKVFFSTAGVPDQVEIKNIEMISISPDYKYYAYLSKQNENWVIHLQSSDFSGRVSTKIDIVNEEKRIDLDKFLKEEKNNAPLQMCWCGLDCIVIVLDQRMLLINIQLKKQFHQRQADIHEIKNSSGKNDKRASKGLYCFQEIDGLRILTSKSNEILRKLPESYINIHKMFSLEPGAKLVEAFEQFENRLPLEDEDVRNKKQDLIEGVKDCIAAGHFELNTSFQTKMLKVAAYGKTFLSAQDIDHNTLFDVCKYLRVINNLKNDCSNRTMTYAQLRNISESNLIQIMLRYNQHHLAFQICKNIEFEEQTTLLPMIYEHWACCIIESNNEDDLCKIIYKKLGDIKGVSFTNIAQRAIDLNKDSLALKLLEYEPSITKRIPVLLGMAENDKNPNQAANFFKMSPNQQYNTPPLPTPQKIDYLKNFNQNELTKFLEVNRNFSEIAYYYLYKALNIKNHQKLNLRVEYLENSLKFMKLETNQDQCVQKLLESEIKMTSLYFEKVGKQKNAPLISIDDHCPVKVIMKLLEADNINEAENVMRTEKINEKKFNIMRIKILIKKEKYEELDLFVEKLNSKKVVIPFEMIADQLIEQQQLQEAVQYIQKMVDLDGKVEILMRLNQQREAVKAIIKEKKEKKLLDIRRRIKDTSIIHLIDENLNKMQKK